MYCLELSGRALGALVGATASVLWVCAIWFPSGGLTLSGASIVVAGLMALLAIFAVIASVKGHGLVLLGVFVASFLPVGAYLLGLEHWLRWVGALDALLVPAGLLILGGSRARAREG